MGRVANGRPAPAWQPDARDALFTDAFVEARRSPEQDYVEQLQAIALDQGDLYDSMVSRGAMFDPSANANNLRDAAGSYDAGLGEQSFRLDEIADEATTGPLASPVASSAAMDRAMSAARGAARSGRGDAALMLREADFVQGAANRYMKQQARADALVESDARRQVAGDATMAAAGLEDAAAKTAAAAEEVASGIERTGADTKADAFEGAARGVSGDASAEADLAMVGSDLEGRGFDVREGIGNTMFEGWAGDRNIKRGMAVQDAERDFQNEQADWRMYGTWGQAAGDAAMHTSNREDDEDNEDDDLGPYRP